MPYTTDVFTTWSNFDSWDALRTWLSSENGGFLRVVEPKDSPFALVRYVKGKSVFALPHVRWCRSVVVDKSSRLPVCVAPPKANDVLSDTLESITHVEEFVDGSMVNLFDAGSSSQTYLATRSRLNADTRFYEGGPSFASMFCDALTAQHIESPMAILPRESKDNAFPTFTSIVLQHPANRIVQKVESPTFYIVHQGHVDSTGVVTIEEDANNFRCESGAEDTAFFQIQPYLLDSVKGARTVQTWVAEKAQKQGFGWQGIVLKDGQGNRWRVRSEVYETVRQIRGNESLDEERFARLRKVRGMDQYLAFFPEDREAFYALEGRLRKNTRQLLQFYIEVFRARTLAYHSLPWPYKHHVSVLHNLFKDTLRAQGSKVNFEEVVKYVNGLSVEDTANMTKQHSLELKPSVQPGSAVAVPAPTPAVSTDAQ